MNVMMCLALALGQAERPAPAVAPTNNTQATGTEREKAEAELSVTINARELEAHVYRLASREFLGRRGPGAARAAHLIADAFRRLGLTPAFGTSYMQPIPWLLTGADKKDSFVGRNVGAVLPGTDPTLKDEWVLLTAHFDHLGGSPKGFYPGADDNASGVAMLLEVAERFALQTEKPKRTIMFVAFDQEENGLLGSAHFARNPPLPLKKLTCFITADMIGRSMVNLMDEYVFVLGTETSPHLLKLVEDVKPPAGLKPGRMGADIIGTRSDYGPFRDRNLPFLFFSTGQHPDYHSMADTPEKIDYAKLERISVWVSDLVWRLANDARAPKWEPSSEPDIDEARTALELMTRVLDNPRAFPLTDGQRKIVVGVQEKLRAIMERGTITAAERGWLAWSARLLLATVFS